MTDSAPEEVEITRDNLETLPAAHQLGVLAVQALKELGTVTFIIRPDGCVAYANPLHVHIEHGAVPDPALLERPFHYVRPILSDGKVRFVAWKDGKLWEIEFDDQGEEHGG